MPLEIVPAKNDVRTEVSNLPAPPKASGKLAPPTSKRKSNCLRIGIWCDDGCTLAPTAGIGDFLYNLVAALLSLKESIEVVMLVHPGDQAVVQSLRSHAAGRLQIVPSGNAKTHLIRAARDAKKPITDIVHRAVGRAVSFLRRSLKAILTRARRGNWLAWLVIACGIACAPAAFLFLWMLYAGNRLVTSGLRGVFYPVGILIRSLRQIGKRKIYCPVVTAESCGCDVWLIPFSGLHHQLTFPAVLLIHDLVQFRFPGSLDQESFPITDQAFRNRAAEATLCACMSGFMRDQVLKGVLGLPEEKIRVIQPAAPADFPPPARSQTAAWKRRGQGKPSLTRPYVFCPSTFHPHKNHRVLIETLHWLRTHFREDAFDLVFTGDTSIPEDLARMIQAYGLTERVHVLGGLDRSKRGDVYQGALATIVPSLDEQDSWPICEAVHWQCPVACSDIFSVREQCAPMGDAMLYFDPRDPDAIARIILQIRNDRKGIASRQHSASRGMWTRTWADVAREWLTVFREAAEIGCHPGFESSERSVA